MLLRANAENGTNGSTVNPGNEWDSVNTSSGANTIYSSTAAIHGNLGYNTTSGTGGTGGYVSWDASLPPLVSEMWSRMYVSIPVNYTGQINQFRYQTNPILRLVFNNTNNLRLTDSSNNVIGISNTVLPLNSPFRVESHLLLSTTNGVVEVRIYLNKDSLTPTEVLGPYTGLNTGTGIDSVWFGPVGSGAVTSLYHDDDAFSTDGWIGPALLAIPWYGV